MEFCFFFSSRRRHTRSTRDWSSDVCSSDLECLDPAVGRECQDGGSAVPVDIELFKNVIGSFPAGVTIVTARGADGVPRGLTSNAVCSVSANPPLLLVCVDKRSQTLPSIQTSGAFVVNFLVAGREELSNRFASKDPDKLAGVAWEP